MRKILISLLMASAAITPSLAFAQDSAADRRAAREQAREDRSSAREERSSAREERSATRENRSSAREERSASREERSAVREERSAVREEQAVQRAGKPAGAAAEQRRAGMRDRAPQTDRVTQPNRASSPAQAAQRDARRQQLADQRVERTEQREARQARYAAIREARRNAAPPPISRTPQPNTQPPPPTGLRPVATPQWSSNWRHNNRYNWYDWRRKNRWLFILGFYSDPFGWGYSPFSIGWRMWPSYYGSNYWLHDPWQYRLPYAPPGTRWIRYYDDAILVDMWGGQVLDVIYDFFW